MIKLKQILYEQKPEYDYGSGKTSQKRIINGMQDYSAFIEKYPPRVNNVASEGVRFVDKIMYNPLKTAVPSFPGYAFGSIIGCIVNYRHYQWDLSGIPGFTYVDDNTSYEVKNSVPGGPNSYQYGSVMMTKNSDLEEEQGSTYKDAGDEGYAIGWDSEIMGLAKNGWWVYTTKDGELKFHSYIS